MYPNMKIFVNHLGFTPDDTLKRAIIKGDKGYTEFAVVDLNEMGYNEIGPKKRENQIAFKGNLYKTETDMGTYLIADFSSLKKPGIYLITLNNEYNSVPFQIREDVYTRTARKAFEYIHTQRCGQEVAGYHGPCHLDDAVRRDTQEHVDTTGGWHDAGDLRKWMAHTMMLGIGISQLKRNADLSWSIFDQKEGDLLNELRWGNNYFLKMINEEGRVWNDVAAGIDGDNSDNRWTDNIIGSGDERHISTQYHPEVQWEFIYLQALISGLFKKVDPIYSSQCLKAAQKALTFLDNNPEYKTTYTAWSMSNAKVKYMAWAILAYKEMYIATGEEVYLKQMKEELKVVLSLQESEYLFNQKKVRGYWYTDFDKNDIFKDLRDSGIILISLCEAYFLLNEDDLKKHCNSAISSYCNDYIVPLAKTNPFHFLPYGTFSKEATEDKYRILAGDLKYRFFSPTKVPFYQGLTSHLLSHAVGLKMAGKILISQELSDVAKSQVEWVMGCNPENSCLMSGEGINNPYPHSRLLGLIPGGIMNGFIGLQNDEPYLDMAYSIDWRTTEYWSPHTCFYLWYISH
jgi:hypothetical protein